MRHLIVSVALIGSLSVVGQMSPQSQAPQMPPTPVAATAAISGVVKDALSGRPIEGAVVELRPPSGLSPGPIIRTTRRLTDERGRFVFIDLVPATPGYTVSAMRMGYVDGAYGQTQMLAPAGKIDLGPDQWFADAEILMWKPGSISGRVVDEFGDPMVGVYVRALARQLVAGRQQLIGTPVGITDDRGEYRIPNLPPGSYLVHVPSVQTTVPSDVTLPPARDAGAMGFVISGLPKEPRIDAQLEAVGPSRLLVGNYATPPTAADGRPQAYPITYFPGGTSHTQAQAIELSIGEERRGIDLALRPVPTSRIIGTVQGPPDALAGLILRLMPVGLEDLSNGEEAATALVAGDGRFAFLNVAAGSYIIDGSRTAVELTYESGPVTQSLPSAPGVGRSGSQSGSVPSAANGTGYVRRSGRGDDLYWVKMPITVGATDIANLSVVLNKSLTLTGRLVYEGTTRTTIESVPLARGGAGPPVQLGQPIPPPPKPDRTPLIYAEPADGSPWLGIPRSVSPGDADGVASDAFRLEGLKGGEYVLRVPGGLGQYSVKSITVGGTDYTHKPIDGMLLSGRGEVIITVTDRLIDVRGVVTDDAGAIGAAAVIAFPVEPDQWTKYGFSPVRIRATPVAGKSGYSMRGLPAGRYFFIAVEGSQVTAWQDPKFLERAARVATRVTLDWDDKKTVDLKLVKVK